MSGTHAVSDLHANKGLLSYCGFSFLNMAKQNKKSRMLLHSGFFGTNGDTELFKKSRNINGFRACRIANNLY